METMQTDRREAAAAPSPTASALAADKVVRQGVLLQGVLGTRGAVEYLKANGIGSAVIGRVLSGGAIRGEDRDGRDAPRAWD